MSRLLNTRSFRCRNNSPQSQTGHPIPAQSPRGGPQPLGGAPRPRRTGRQRARAKGRGQGKGQGRKEGRPVGGIAAGDKQWGEAPDLECSGRGSLPRVDGAGGGGGIEATTAGPNPSTGTPIQLAFVGRESSPRRHRPKTTYLPVLARDSRSLAWPGGCWTGTSFFLLLLPYVSLF